MVHEYRIEYKCTFKKRKRKVERIGVRVSEYDKKLGRYIDLKA
jgi:hypothetical protein